VSVTKNSAEIQTQLSCFNFAIKYKVQIKWCVLINLIKICNCIYEWT